MHLIPIRLPDTYINTIDEMVLEGRYASRSEAIRLALRDYYREHFTGKQTFKELNLPGIDLESMKAKIIYEDE